MTYRPHPIVVAGEGPLSTTVSLATEEVVDADIRRMTMLAPSACQPLRGLVLHPFADLDRDATARLDRSRQQPVPRCLARAVCQSDVAMVQLIIAIPHDRRT